jgi:putative membrane protein insertion efficiency factor
VKSAALGAIRFYQRAISPGLPAGCRFQPTCSHYGYDAIKRHGVLKGIALTAWRLARCNPFNSGGYDPVP